MENLIFTDRRNLDSEKWEKYPKEVIPAWVADADYTAAKAIIAAMRQRLDHGVFGYSTAPPELPQTICEYFSHRWNWNIQPEWINYSPGLGVAIHNSCRLAAGGAILTPQPIYHVFRDAPQLAQAQRIDVPMEYDGNTWQLPMQALENAKNNDAACNSKVFQLCNPHNPNGKVYSKDELFAIAEFCERHDLIIFSDEVHADLILDSEPTHIPIASLAPEIAQRTITVQSPSKAYNIAGLNFAVVIIENDALRARYQQAARGKVLEHLNPFGYNAAVAAYNGSCEAWWLAQRTHLRANRQRLQTAIDELPAVTMPHLASTYLAWINVEALQLADAPAHFLRHGLGMSPGEDFGDARYMRANFACSPESLEEIIKRFTAAVGAA